MLICAIYFDRLRSMLDTSACTLTLLRSSVL